MSDPMVILERLQADDPMIQKVRSAVLSGSADRVEIGTTSMERLFNDHTAESAREYIYCHPDDERFVPEELHEPRLVNMEMQGFTDAEFDGEPWFPGIRTATGQDAAGLDGAAKGPRPIDEDGGIVDAQR